MEFEEKLAAFAREAAVARLADWPHHRVTTALDHCLRVARISRRLARALRLTVDEDALLRGAMLHDYYFYRPSPRRPWSHLRGHPATALRNARRSFALSEKEENIILSHMWPLRLRPLPGSREAWLVSAADKLATLRECAGILPSLLRRR